MALSLQHTKGDQVTRHMMLLSLVRARLTARQAQVLLTDPDDFLALGAKRRQAAYFTGRQRQAIRGIGPWRRI
jgi:hypothetical protein